MSKGFGIMFIGLSIHRYIEYINFHMLLSNGSRNCSWYNWNAASAVISLYKHWQFLLLPVECRKLGTSRIPQNLSRCLWKLQQKSKHPTNKKQRKGAKKDSDWSRVLEPAKGNYKLSNINISCILSELTRVQYRLHRNFPRPGKNKREKTIFF